MEIVVVLASKCLIQPANGVRSTRSLVKIHNTYFKFSVINGQFSIVQIETATCGTIFKSWLGNCALAKALIKLSYFSGLSTETRAPNQKK